MKYRILIVEDESIVALDIQTRLENHGFSVIGIVSTGSRAIEKARDEKPDLILMDINLKGSIDGVETASLIRRELDCPILFLTAYADEKTIKRARISDASGYILKPFRESELLVTIELAIKRSIVKKKIEDNSNWLYSTLNNITDAVITVSEEKRIVFLNPTARRLLGEDYSSGSIFNEEDFIVKKGHRVVFKMDEMVLDIEYTVTDIFDDEKNLLGKVHNIHDISRQVAYEIGLEKARAAAEDSNRLKDDFLANVTHELRTPLNTIIGMNSLISELSEDREISEMHSLIGKAAESLLSQVNELLDLAEIDRGQAKIINSRFSLKKLMDDVLMTFRAQAELKSLELKSELPDFPIIEGDRIKIRDITACLLSNSVKFTRKGSVILSGYMEGDMVKLFFRDTGIGIPEQQKEMIFEQFTQGDGSRTRYFGGVGLGLTLVSKIVKLLGGSITVESRELEGTTFMITLPVHISSDQESPVDTFAKKHSAISIGTANSGALKQLAESIAGHCVKDEYHLCEKMIEDFRKEKDIIISDAESQVLYSISTAVKLKNREKLDIIIDELTDGSSHSSGGVYENSYSRR